MAIETRGLAPMLYVFDMPTSVAFYRDMLGFELVMTSTPSDGRFDWAMFRHSGSELMLNTAYEAHARPPAPDRARIAAHADTVIYFGCPDVEGAYEALRAKGLAIKPPVLTGYGFRALSLSDPDGYGLCFHWPVK
ncbi:MAG: VOC family protein [Phycisphaerales bacterium]